MGIADRAKKMAAGAASVAVATSGLSSCGVGGVVDPAPPALQCNDVSAGQILVATGTRAGETITVTITEPSFESARWLVTDITNVTGATLAGSSLRPNGTEPLVLTFTLASPTTTQATFTVGGRFTGHRNETCDFLRTFIITVSGNSVQVAQLNLDRLPLPARQRAQIALVARDGRVVELEAHSPFVGARRVSWEVSGGSLGAPLGDRIAWTLPADPGIYQAELVVDYGPDGLAFDALMLEVNG